MSEVTDPIVRHGARVSIRGPRASDAEEFIALNRISTHHYHPWIAAPLTTEEYEAYLARAARTDTACFFACHGETQAILGVVNLSQIFFGNFCSAYMGYFIGAPYAGQGFMREAIGLVLDHAFDALGLHRVEANIQPDNSASLALIRSLGFTREGFSRRYLKISGDWRDHERWAILSEDWAGLRG